MQKQVSTITGIAVIIATAAIAAAGILAYQYFQKFQSPITSFQSNPNVQSLNTEATKCSDLYWFDNLNSCSQTTKQFCGTYMYYGLHTFNSEQECLNGWSMASGRGPITNQPYIQVISPSKEDVWQAINDVNIIKWKYGGIDENASVSIEIVDQNDKTVCDVSEGWVPLRDKQLVVNNSYLSAPRCVGSNRRIQIIFHGNKTTAPDHDLIEYSDYFNIVNS